MKKMKQKARKTVALIVMFSVIFSSIGLQSIVVKAEEKNDVNVPAVATTSDATEDATENATEVMDPAVQEVEMQKGVTGVVTQQEHVIEKEGYRIVCSNVDLWENHSNVTITVVNTGDEVIHNWALQYPIDGEIENLWNAYVYEQKDNTYIIKNLGWNQDIGIGQTVSFGYTLNAENANLPENAEIIALNHRVSSRKYDLKYEITNSWETGCNATICITNNRDKAIEDWSLEFDYPNEIVDISNAVIAERIGNHYVIRNPEYQQNINSHASVYIQLRIDLGDEEALLDNIQLMEVRTGLDAATDYGVKIDGSGLFWDSENMMYIVSEQLTELKGTIDSADSVLEAGYVVTNDKGMKLKESSFLIDEEFCINDIGLILGKNHITVSVLYADGKEAVDSIVIDNRFEGNMDLLNIDWSDKDGDGLNGYLEELYGTNPELADSDGDGLSDYEELVVLGMNPNLVDSDGNGVSDGDEDADGDGLVNAQELELGTGNCTGDTDGDLLSDYDEIMVYHTNPTQKDTDGDGADDKWEIQNGFDANVYDETFCIHDSLEGISTSMKLELVADGKYIQSYQSAVYSEDLFLNMLVPGYLGSAYDFNLDGAFQSARLTYYFDESNLNVDNFNPVVYYYNQSEQCLEPIATSWDGVSNYVTADLPHFSTYILLNKTEFDKVWQSEFLPDKAEDNKKIEIVFLVDSSGSMMSNDPQRIRVQVVKEFIEKLSEQDNMAIVSFDSYVEKLLAFTNNKEKAYEALNNVGDVGWDTRIGAAITYAIGLFNGENAGVNRYVILLTDGYSSDAARGYQERCEQLGIKIYTIGLGSVDTNYLEAIAQNTGGKYYYASSARDLQEAFEKVESDVQADRMVDENNDGISDYYARLLCEGKLRLATGVVYADLYGYDYGAFQNGNDLDHDGLINGEEIEIIGSNNRAFVKVLSDVTQEDTDGDGWDDYEERQQGTDPFMHNVSKSDMDYLLNDDIYLSTIYSHQYMDTNWKYQLYAGNVLSNYKLSYVQDYQNALLNFCDIYSGEIQHINMMDAAMDAYKNDLTQKSLSLVSMMLEVQEVARTAEEGAEFWQMLCKANQEVIEARNSIKNFNAQSVYEAFSRQLVDDYAKLDWKLKSNMAQSIFYQNKMNSLKVTNMNSNMFTKFIYKMPPNIVDGLKNFGKALAGGVTFLNMCADVTDDIRAYSTVCGNMETYQELDEFLLNVSIFCDDLMLREAAINVRGALASDLQEMGQVIRSISFDVADNAGEYAIGYYMSKYGAGWGVCIGTAVGKLLTNNGTLNEEFLKVMAMGGSATSYGFPISLGLMEDGSFYYKTQDEKILKKMQLLGQLRIMGEDETAATFSTRT